MVCVDSRAHPSSASRTREGGPRARAKAGPAVLPAHESPGARGNTSRSLAPRPGPTILESSQTSMHHPEKPPRREQQRGFGMRIRACVALSTRKSTSTNRDQTSATPSPPGGGPAPDRQIAPMQSNPGRARDVGALAVSRRWRLGPGRPSLLPSFALHLLGGSTRGANDRCSGRSWRGTPGIRGKHSRLQPRNHRPTHHEGCAGLEAPARWRDHGRRTSGRACLAQPGAA